MTSVTTFRSTLILLLALAMAVPASAQEPQFTLRIGSVAPSGTPWFKIVKKIKRRIKKKAGDRIKIKTFLGNSLGGEKSIVRRVQKGQLEMFGVSTGALATVIPELNAYELPYLFDSYAQADKALDATYELAAEIMAAKGFKLYFWSENGFRDFATKETFVRTPSDLAGMKMRAQESFVHIGMYKKLGAKPNAIPVPQVAEDLANGVVTGYDNTWLYSFAAQWYKHVKYVTESNHIYQPAVIAYNKKWFDKLPADLQAILMENVKKYTKTGRKKIRAMNGSLRAMFEQDGVQFYTPTKAQRAQMKAKTKAVYSTFRSRAGAKGTALLDAIIKAK